MSAILVTAFLVPIGVAAQAFPLNSDKGLDPHNVTVKCVSYRGRNAVRVISLPSADAVYDAQKSGTGGGIVVLQGTSFHDGTIDVDVAGKPQADPTWADHTGTNFGSVVHQEYGERAFSLGFSALRETALARCNLAAFQAKLLIDLD